LRTITGGKALRDIKTFLRDSLNIAHWNMPKDNADIRRILCQAVANNRLIPIIDRDYEGLPRVALPDPVPLRWPSSDFGGGGSYSGGSGFGFAPGVIGYDEFTALQRANGELSGVSADIASAAISAVIQPQQSLGTATSSGGGFDWLGTAETVAGAMFDGNVDTNDSEEDFSSDAADDSTPLDNAQPFEYTPDAIGDAEQDAGVFLTPAEETECEMQFNADMDECSAWYAMKPSSWGICKDRAMQRYAGCLKGASID
jgi:hypothetical protein